MRDTAERFVATWSSQNLKGLRRRKDFAETVEDLTCKLQVDAWAFGLSRDEFLQAVGGDAYEYALYEVEEGLMPTSIDPNR